MTPSLPSIVEVDEDKVLIDRLMLNSPVITQGHMDAATEIMPQAASRIIALKADNARQKMALDSEAKIVVDMAGAADAISPQMIEAMLPLLTNPMLQASDMRAERAETERDEARAALGLAYETAAQVAADMSDEYAVSGEYADISELTADVSERIRALDPDATVAFKRAIDAETRACIAACSEAAHGYSERQAASKGKEARDWESMKLAALNVRDAILARLDQHKEGGA